MFIPYLIIILCLSGLVFVVFRKIPTLVKLPAEPDINAAPAILLMERAVNLLKQISHPSYWLIFLGWLEKFLRRIRISFLKIDNFFVSLIAKSRDKSYELTAKSKLWVSERRVKKIEKLKLLADLRRTPEEKEGMLLSILKQNPRDIKAYKELGLLYLEKKNIYDAQAAFEEVLKINPEDETAIAKLEEIKTMNDGVNSQ